MKEINKTRKNVFPSDDLVLPFTDIRPTTDMERGQLLAGEETHDDDDVKVSQASLTPDNDEMGRKHWLQHEKKRIIIVVFLLL